MSGFDLFVACALILLALLGGSMVDRVATLEDRVGELEDGDDHHQ